MKYTKRLLFYYTYLRHVLSYSYKYKDMSRQREGLGRLCILCACRHSSKTNTIDFSIIYSFMHSCKPIPTASFSSSDPLVHSLLSCRLVQAISLSLSFSLSLSLSLSASIQASKTVNQAQMFQCVCLTPNPPGLSSHYPVRAAVNKLYYGRAEPSSSGNTALAGMSGLKSVLVPCHFALYSLCCLS